MRWQPSPEQISLIIDCEVSHTPLERAAALLGIKPRTLKTFLKRLGAARAPQVISSGTVGLLTAKSVSASEGRPGGSPA